MISSLTLSLKGGVLKTAGKVLWHFPVLKTIAKKTLSTIVRGDAVIKKGIGKGLRFNSFEGNVLFSIGIAELFVQKVMVRFVRPGMTAYDIGAANGFFSILLSQLVSQEGKVISIEPAPKNLEYIEHNAKLNSMNNVHIVGAAISSFCGTAKFTLSSDPSWGVLASIGPNIPSKIGEIVVQVKTLDSLLLTDHLPIPGFIKVDIEGAEVDMFAGASYMFESVRPTFVIEVHGTDAFVAVSQELKKRNYASVVANRLPLSGESWYYSSHITAVPQEKAELVEILHQLQGCISLGHGATNFDEVSPAA